MRPGTSVCQHGAWGSSSVEGWPTYPLSPFRLSSEKGCSTCAMLLGVIEEFKPGWTATNEGRKSIEIEYEPVSLTITLIENGGPVGNFRLVSRSPEDDMFPRYCNAGAYSGSQVLPVSLEVMPDSNLDTALERAKFWLSYCTMNDEPCRITRTAFTPQRLLAVDLSPNEGEVFILEPTGKVEYACLSYCWGRDLAGVLTTTRENFSAFHKSINICNLPKTIQDAIRVCRAIGVLYLWVDSLCIIQDDAADWAEQSRLMVDIYGQSQLTIYADSPSSCKDGFLGPQQYGAVSWQRPLKTLLPDSLGCIGTGLFLRNACEGGVDHFCRRPQTSKSALSTRGWCLQEWLLPCRRLGFDTNEMWWDCQCRQMCECGHLIGERAMYFETAPLRTAKEILSLHNRSEDDLIVRQPQHWVERDWLSIVQEYTMRDISRPDDKFNAISGLALIFLKASNLAGINIGKYCAGMWSREDLFVRGLCWMVKKQSKPDIYQEPSGYRAPTWSWASQNKPVYFPSGRWRRETMNSHVVIHKIECELVTPGDSTGRVKAGFVDLQGHIVELELMNLDEECQERWWQRQRKLHPTDESAEQTLVRGKNPRAYPATLDVLAGPVLDHASTHSECWITRRRCFDCSSCYENIKQSFNLSESKSRKDVDYAPNYFGLEILTWEDRISCWLGYYRGLEPQTLFLVLKRHSNTPGVFERVGVGLCNAREDYDEGILWKRLSSQIGFCDAQEDSDRSDFWEPHPRYTRSNDYFQCPLFEGSKVESIRIV